MGPEWQQRVAVGCLMITCFLLVASVAAVVGAMTYAGWIEPGGVRWSDIETPP